MSYCGECNSKMNYNIDENFWICESCRNKKREDKIVKYICLNCKEEETVRKYIGDGWNFHYFECPKCKRTVFNTQKYRTKIKDMLKR